MYSISISDDTDSMLKFSSISSFCHYMYTWGSSRVLQGSVLGTTLFLIFIYDIIKCIRRIIRLLEVDTRLVKM